MRYEEQLQASYDRGYSQRGEEINHVLEELLHDKLISKEAANELRRILSLGGV